MKEEKIEPEKNRKVNVVVLYTLTAEEKKFVAEQDETLKEVVNEAYKKLRENPRPGDQIFCHGEVRHDLASHLPATLREMKEKGICVRESKRGKLEFAFDIDAEVGGAAS